MPSPQSFSAKDDNGQRLKREEALHRSLRECTTRRLTHFNPCILKHAHNAPTLTSRVQWGAERPHSEDVPVRDTDCDMKNVKDDVQDSRPPPVLSEIDELVPSDDDQPPPNSRPSTVVYSSSRPLYAPRKTTPASDDTHSSRSYSDSSDTERRQPNFPGNRDIIDGRFPSTSPSPPTQHSAELETPSPVSDVPNDWEPSYSSKSSTSLGLHLNTIDKPPSRDDRLDRVDSWRVASTSGSGYHNHSLPYEHYGNRSLHDMTRNPRLAYSPSISASSPPSSPPPVLPPIHHLNATLPVNTGSTPGVMHWRFREDVGSHNLKRISPAYHSLADEYDDVRSSTESPHSLPPLLPHIKMIAQTYPTQRTVPPIMPMSVAPPLPPVTNPTRNKNAWKDYAQLVSGPNEQTEFRCIWRVGFTGETTDHCGYTAKRHLVKRHIETRHLQFKDHICPYCGKAFPQRVSLMIHVNRHTGAKPHPCRYVDCDKTFSDPARRHKHMVEAHGYNPQGPRKRHRTVDSYHANANFETLAPWTTKGESPEGGMVGA